MNRKLHVNERKKLKSDYDEKEYKSLREKDIPKVRGRKLGGLDTIDSKKEELKNSTFKQKLFSKKRITYFVLLLVDVILIIYVARKNVVNYVDINGKNIFIGDKKNLWFGRNYISLIVTAFFYLYTCILNRYFLHERNTKKFLAGLLFVLIILNELFFYLFTIRVY